MLNSFLEKREKFNQFLDSVALDLWNTVYNFFISTGSIAIFMYESLKLFGSKPKRTDEIIRHMEFIGNKSVLIILLTGSFTGMALSYQIYLGFQLVNATNLVGPTVALGITRELGPVLTGLIVSARAGGAMAARLGTMRVSEQIDALEVMGVDPKQYLVMPRMVAALITMPLLCGIFDFIAMLGSHLLCINVLGLDEAIFWDKIQLWINPRDINEGLIKSAVFGLTFATICSNAGYFTKGGAKGVGEATNKGVVNSMVLIIILNFIMTNLIRFYYTLTG
ncbi:MAG: ABC transporter permease [Bdellovibrionaceae bacterium]|nr:ABC transporter permease [Pseudobdellovibrionaceae bacterium]